MLGFVRNFVPQRGTPIGVDLGGCVVRLAQVERAGDELRLIHADAIDVAATDGGPTDLGRVLRESLRAGKFVGRLANVALPPSSVQIKHVRVGRGDRADVAGQVNEQALALLGGDAGDWHLRHVIAGDTFGDNAPQQEAIVFGTPQETVARLVDDANAARVELAGLHVHPRVISASFAEFHRRKADAEAVNLFVDLGGLGTRAVVAAPVEIRFVRDIALRVDAIHERIAAALRLDPDAAAILRRSAIARQTGRSNEIPAAPASPSDPQALLEAATGVEAQRLAAELDLCRRYYDATFPAKPVTKLIFIGGGARDRLLCAAVAQAMALPAQVGDPLVRFNRAALPTLACIDRREAQPEWAAAIGLSLIGRAAGVVAVAA